MTARFAPVQPHGPLQPIFDDVYWVTGTVVFKPIVRLARNMVVLRHDGVLTLIKSVRLDEQGEAALNAIGTGRHVRRIGVRAMDDACDRDRYGARYWTPAGVGGAEV